MERELILYKTAYSYLVELLPVEMRETDLEKYFKGDDRDFHSLQDVYIRIIASAQNYQQMPNAIKFYERKQQIGEMLYDFDYSRISEMDVEDLYSSFRDRFDVTSPNNKFNSWHKWSKSVIDASKFMRNFSDVEDFREFVNRFDYNPLTRMALPLMISQKISGIGFALACDFLKELGYVNYPKPDVHILSVLSETGMAANNQISAFESIAQISNVCQREDSTATAYKIDKILWLVCSGNYYLDDIRIGRHKEDLINRINKCFAEDY